MYAVIRAGGKQYRVAQDDVIDIDRVSGDTGSSFELNDILLVGGGEGDPQIGAPLVSGAIVSAEIVEHRRGDKITIFKKKRRTTYRRKQGHRQELTTIRITGISLDGEKPKKQTKAKSAAKPEEGGEETKAAKAKSTGKTESGGEAAKTAQPAKTTKAKTAKTEE